MPYALKWRITRQEVRRITGWTLPVIDDLSYIDILDVTQYHYEHQRALAEAKRRAGRRRGR